MPKYRFGFLLNTTVGNMTRYLNLRKFAERDDDVKCHWVTLDHLPRTSRSWIARQVSKLLSPVMALRLRLLLQTVRQVPQLGRQDALMLHLFEAEVLFALRRIVRRAPVLIASNDDAPVFDPADYPLYPHQTSRSPRRRALRLRLDRWRMGRFDGFVPFSKWGGNLLMRACDIPPEKVAAVHVGLDLAVWSRDVIRAAGAHAGTRLLFVGNDFERKGGPLLLTAFARHFSGSADLDVVTPQAPDRLPPSVRVHPALRPNEPALVALYAAADIFVLPSTADLVPWAVLEAMAMECAVVATRVGAIGEIVEDGVTGFLVPPNDEAALIEALRRLIADPALRARMGRLGRARIELDFDASKNVPRILAFMKGRVDQRR